MTTAKLSATLLAPKGNARPLPNIYDHPMQKPISYGFDIEPPGRLKAEPSGPHSRTGDPRSRTGDPRSRTGDDDAKLSLRLAREQHRKLKIVAARRGISLQNLLREALAAYLVDKDHDCPCMRDDHSRSCRCRH